MIVKQSPSRTKKELTTLNLIEFLDRDRSVTILGFGSRPHLGKESWKWWNDDSS